MEIVKVAQLGWIIGMPPDKIGRVGISATADEMFWSQQTLIKDSC